MSVSRRGLLKGALGIGAAAAGSRIVGPWLGEARAAGEPSHFVHIFIHGGLNAFFAGCAQKLQGKFGLTSADAVFPVGNDVFTDAGTFGKFPKFALDHWAGIGLRHNDANHTVPENRNGGGEMAIVRNGNMNYLNQLAAAMGGDSPMKAVLLGRRSSDYGVYAPWPAVKGTDGKDVPLQKVNNLRDALKIAGAEAPTGDAPDRARLAATLEAAQQISARQIATNPGRLTPLNSSYGVAVESLNKPLPKPVTFEEVNTAYKLNGREAIGTQGSATAWAAQFAMAEILIRAVGTNVIHIGTFEPMWDFDAAGNGISSVRRFLGSNGNYNHLDPIRTFLDRMLNFPGRNVVVAISGEFVRELNGHGHGAGVVAAVFGKNVRQGLSFPVNESAKFAPGTPGSKGFWAGIAAACNVSGQPFGANPHSKLLG